ncbi:MAG: GNAT family N-acetyltransferase [Clostridia bacterium]|nr:GNAT family N-acetyltransferase [Clostridia bacterium]
MKMDGFSARRTRTVGQWFRVYRLYERSFPDSERKPFPMIVKMHLKKKTDVWYFTLNGRFAGFASTINSDELILIDYLAVSEKLRGQGAGSKAIEALKESYPDKGLYVEIESPYEPGEDQKERIRRKRFYERCGMKPMNVMANVFGVKMELLTWNCEVDFERYHSFYRDEYSPWAADHIIEAEHPEK